VRGSWTVAWVQFPSLAPKTETYQFAARTAVAAFGAPTSDVKDATENEKHILKKCLKDGYNECVVKAELAAHNDARLARKDAPALAHDSAASVKIQAMLNDKTANYASQASFPSL